ncbi:MAG: tetratricopeptide repeat protein [Rhodomicrobium sp.]
MQVLRYILSYLFLLSMLPLPALANDWPDCKLSAPDIRIAACTRIIRRGSWNQRDLAPAFRSRALAYRRQKDKDKAIADLHEAMRIDPGGAAYVRGLIYYIEEDYDRAIAEFGAAIEADPRNAAIYNSRGNAYSAKGERDLAIADFSEAVRIEPDFALALSNRGNLYRVKGDFEAAIADIGKAIQLKPNYSVAYYHRAGAYGRKGEFDAGIVDCDRAIQLDPQYAEAYNYRGYLYYRKRDYDRAIADTSKAIGLKPELANAYNDRGLAYAAKRDRVRALADYNKAIELNPKFSFPYNNRALIYLVKNEVDRAIASYGKAIELDPKYAIAYYSRGKAYEGKGDIDRALADYRKVLDLPALTNTDEQRKEIVRQRIAALAQAPRGAEAERSKPAFTARRVALVIGNSNYAHAGILSNPKNDAGAVAASLRHLGFGQVIELYDQSREQMAQALKNFGDLAEGSEWAVVFFAGHGFEMNGETYLVPADAELLRDTHVTDETVSLTQVQAKVDAATKLGLVILDSCRNNPFLAHMARSAGASRAISQGLANVEPEGNVLVAYSAKHGTTAQDGAGAHSPFTAALLDHIEEPGLEINFLFRKVRDEVRAKTQRQQEPYLYGSLSAEPLYFRAAAQN